MICGWQFPLQLGVVVVFINFDFLDMIMCFWSKEISVRFPQCSNSSNDILYTYQYYAYILIYVPL